MSVIGLVLLTWASLQLAAKLYNVITWFVAAAFFAAVMAPGVAALDKRIKKRGASTAIVFFTALLVFAAMMYAFINPLVQQTRNFADNFPEFVEKAKNGEGTVGDIVKRYNLDEWVNENQDKLQEFATSAGKLALQNVPKAAGILGTTITILLLTFLILLRGPGIIDVSKQLIPVRHRDRVLRVARKCNQAITGYMYGNLLISIIAGVAAFVELIIVGVPFAGVLALWVAFADLIPLVGATLGAIPPVAVAFLHSVPAGIITLIFFIIYQQFENNVLQVTIMSRTVDLNPLAVMASVLIGVTLLGILGALLAIPAGGVVQVIVKDWWDTRNEKLAIAQSKQGPRGEN